MKESVRLGNHGKTSLGVEDFCDGLLLLRPNRLACISRRALRWHAILSQIRLKDAVLSTPLEMISPLVSPRTLLNLPDSLIFTAFCSLTGLYAISTVTMSPTTSLCDLPFEILL